MPKIKPIIQLFLLTISVLTFGQELPPIHSFTPQDYGADDQNWSISQAIDKTIYVSNNEGLLEYNGSKWRLYDSPNGTILRSVKVINDKVYTGSYMDFGFWQKNQYGSLVYTSLKDKAGVNKVEDEEFWQIVELDDWVLFQSFERIFIYNTQDNTFRVITSKSRINKIFKIDKTIYFQKSNEGLFKIENGSALLFNDNIILKQNEIVNIFQNSNSLLIQTKEAGFYNLKPDELRQWNITANALLNTVSVYNSLRTKNGTFVLGTISNGIIQLNEKGEVILQIKQENGISNNTILSLFEDVDQNIWLGLDNGINILYLNSPYRVYKDKQGVLGTIYALSATAEYLYIGTNQGLFYKAINSKDKFTLIEGTRGQVWSLNLINETLFCGHDKGTFLVEKNKATSLSNIKGTWLVKEIPNQPNLLLKGNYKGLYILEKINNKWVFRNKIKGFNISSRYVEFLNSNEILISHEYKGVYHLKLNEDYTEVTNYFKEDVDKGRNSGLVKYNDRVLYIYEKGVLAYNDKDNKFENDTIFSAIFSNKNYVSGHLVNDKENNKLWGFTKNQMLYIQPGNLSSEPNITKIPLTESERKSKSGYENILNIEGNTYLMGTKEGYLILDLNKLSQPKYKIYLSAVTYNTFQDEKIPLPINSENKEIELKTKNNDVHFVYNISDFNKFSPTLYQYKLEGIYENWSTWSQVPEVYFNNLPHGNYTFKVKAKVGNNESLNTIVYQFTIQKPWYLRPWAFLIYVLGFLSITLLIQYFNKRYYTKQRQVLLDKKQKELEIKELENKRRLIEFKNENLQLDIENKNRELGISTMSLIKKNELLNAIKKEISDAKSTDDLKSVVKLINKNLNTTDDWKLFEEAFNNADKDFLKKIKTKHPALTSNDLRLCAYLRLNLSSKEVAPLLNISPRSVEVKRYRLRKKMNLPHKKSLTDYILEI